MIKHILLFFTFAITLVAGVIKTPIITLDKSNNLATVKVDNIDVGVSGFIVQRLSKNNSTILKNVEVIKFDKRTRAATLKMSDFKQFKHTALPSGNWKPEVGDIVILAFGYSRALLIAPSEEVYHRITKATKQVQWLHPDIFATVLSLNGHPTPLKEDFRKMHDETSVGLVFFYLNKKLFTVDIKSMKIINIADAPLKQESVKLPFYTRVDEISSNWWGAGSDELESYEPYYYKLLIENNPNNRELQALYSQFKNKN